jgi:hypothetical protein
MTDDHHPPGESGMNGMTAIVNVVESTGGDGGLPDLLPIVDAGRSAPNLIVLVVIGALLALAHRTRRRHHLPTKQS